MTKIDQNELNSMYGHVACPKRNGYLIMVAAIHIALWFPYFIISPNIMTEQKGKVYQGIRANEAFEYENTRSDFNYCYHWEKLKTMTD